MILHFRLFCTIVYCQLVCFSQTQHSKATSHVIVLCNSVVQRNQSLLQFNDTILPCLISHTRLCILSSCLYSIDTCNPDRKHIYTQGIGLLLSQDVPLISSCFYLLRNLKVVQKNCQILLLSMDVLPKQIQTQFKNSLLL